MRLGLPVVSTDCPHGPGEIIRHGVDGCFVLRDSTRGVADALVALMRDDGRRAEIGRAAPSQCGETIHPGWHRRPLRVPVQHTRGGVGRAVRSSTARPRPTGVTVPPCSPPRQASSPAARLVPRAAQAGPGRMNADRTAASAQRMLWIVVGGFCLLSAVLVPLTLPLGWDEIVYAGRFGSYGPATPFSAPRTRGVPMLLAPIASWSDSTALLRVWLFLLAGGALWLGFRPWLRILYRPAAVWVASGRTTPTFRCSRSARGSTCGSRTASAPTATTLSTWSHERHHRPLRKRAR